MSKIWNNSAFNAGPKKGTTLEITAKVTINGSESTIANLLETVKPRKKRQRICVKMGNRTYECVERAVGDHLFKWYDYQRKPYIEIRYALFSTETPKKIRKSEADILPDTARVIYRKYWHGVLALEVIGSMGYLREEDLL